MVQDQLGQRSDMAEWGDKGWLNFCKAMKNCVHLVDQAKGDHACEISAGKQGCTPGELMVWAEKRATDARAAAKKAKKVYLHRCVNALVHGWIHTCVHA